MGEMRDSDWSRPNLLRSDWLPIHVAIMTTDVCLVFNIKDHHLYPMLDDHLKQIATYPNQGGTDNLWKYMSDMKWSNKSSNYIKYEALVNNLAELIEGPNKPTDEIEETNRPTLSTIENRVIILPPDTKVEPVIEEYKIT